MVEPIISFQDAKIFQEDYLVLSNVTFEVGKNEFVYLVGKVGSGKTSLIKTMNAELPLKEGSATIAGIQLEQLKRKGIPNLRRKMGIVFQDFQLLVDRSIHENLKFVLTATGWRNKTDIENRIEEVLQMVGLDYKGYKMPHQLSGGEQQRVVIARALLNDPDIILADEPTGNLDPDTSDSIMQILLGIQKAGRSVIMATHNYPLLKKYPSRTLQCQNGKVLEIGAETLPDIVSQLATN